MDLVDAKYIGLVSSRLKKFKRVKENLFNFRCPICGDSQKHKNKARGYFYRVKNDMFFKCHNCGMGQNLISSQHMLLSNVLTLVELEGRKNIAVDKSIM